MSWLRSPYSLVLLLVLAPAGYWIHGSVTHSSFVPSFNPRTTPYAGSAACRTCHSDHYDSWYHTYHRTMTAPATPDHVKAPIDGTVIVGFYGISTTFRKSGDRYTVTLPGPDGAVREFPILYTIGSRRMQQFAIRDGDRIFRIPVFYNLEEKKWMHINEAFFRRKAQGLEAFRQGYGIWNPNCIFCHNTRPHPGWDQNSRTFHSTVAETGIACEECHAPGADHVEQDHNPLRRYYVHYFRKSDPTIVQPAKVDPLRSVQICGQCHGQRLPNPLDRIQDLMANDDPYAPGQDLFKFYKPVAASDQLQNYKQFYLRFWNDGSPRLTAFEMQAVLASSCFKNSSTFTCLTCHSAHSGDPKGMIRPEMRTDAACTRCHAKYGIPAEAAKHSGHRGGSATCYDCHMPETVYGVMTLHPTHLIRNPNPFDTISYNMPNACSLCHLDQSVNWSIAHYNRLWRKNLPTGDPSYDVPEIIRGFATGDAVYRVVLLDRARRLKLKGFDAVFLKGLADDFDSVSHFAERALESEYSRSFPNSTGWSTYLASTRPIPELELLRAQQKPDEPFDFGE